MKLLHKTLAGCIFLLITSHALAEIKISHAWLRLLPPTMTTTAGYMTIYSDQADTLLSLSSPIANSVELHQSKMEDGMMSMSSVDKLAIPAKGTVTLSPQGYHLMVIGLKQPLKKGQAYSMLLRFEQAGEISILVPVEAH